MNIFEGLFKSRQQRNYDVRLSAVDNRKNLGNNYRENVLKNSLSSYIFRNVAMNDFINLVQEFIADHIDTVNMLKIYKSYTIRKDDDKVR